MKLSSKIKFLMQFFKMVPKSLKLANKANIDNYQTNYHQLHQLCLELIDKSIFELTSNQIVYLNNNQPNLLVANHQGTLDPLFLIAAIDKPCSFISKQENAKIPLLGKWGKLIGNIHFDRNSLEGNIQMLRNSARRLSKKDDLLIFPEGTRSKKDEMRSFKEHALKIAYMTKANIIPITLNNSYAFDCNQDSGNMVEVYFHQAISYEEYQNIAEADLNKHVQKIIQSKLKK